MSILAPLLALLFIMISYGSVRLNKLFTEEEQISTTLAVFSPYVFVFFVLLDMVCAAVCSQAKLDEINKAINGGD